MYSKSVVQRRAAECRARREIEIERARERASRCGGEGKDETIRAGLSWDDEGTGPDEQLVLHRLRKNDGQNEPGNAQTAAAAWAGARGGGGRTEEGGREY
jgi:hypothetical protein